MGDIPFPSADDGGCAFWGCSSGRRNDACHRLPLDHVEAEEEVMKLVEAAKAPGTALAPLFEEEVVPPTPTADTGDPRL